ncbi:MAG: hypothetical protein KF753_18575 [Caldilineaceae bacterium]|nr:hypothetical protein [Caldilineaceae bacterium]
MITTSTKQPSTPAKSDFDYGLQSDFLARMDEESKLRIFDLTTRASRELHRWAASYPLIRRVRVWPLSLSVTAAAPFASASALVSMARVSLWVFTIDDLFDEETVPFAELRRRVERYKEIVDGDNGVQRRDRDTLVLALRDILEDLATYPLFPALQEEWSSAVHGTLDGMMREHEWRTHYRADRATDQLPDYDTYLENGLYTVGGPPHIWTTLIAINDPTMLDHYTRIKDLAMAASTCIRLANDLRSYDKEIAEFKINSIVILQRQAMAAGHNEDAAMQWACDIVRQDIQRGLELCKHLQDADKTQTGYPERAIADIARFVCDFYVNHDYHTFTTGAGR